MRVLNDKIIASLLIILFTCGVIIPPLIQSTIGYQFDKVVALNGTPIEQTPFEILIDETSDRAVLPHGEVIQSSDGSIHMNTNPLGQETLNLSMSVASARDFFSFIPYLEEQELVHDNTSASLFELKWNLYFGNQDVQLFLVVNAISGRVIYYRLRLDTTQIAGNFSDTERKTPEDAEQSAIHFLAESNYSLSPFALFMCTIEEPILGYEAYTSTFYNVVNDSLVWFNEFSISVHAITGMVLAFSYYWHDVNHLPTEGIITPEEGAKAALEYLATYHGENDTLVDSMMLMFQEIGSEFWLCWVVFTDDSDRFYVVSIDAFTGEYRTLQQRGVEDEVVPYIQYTSPYHSTNQLVLISIGILVSITAGIFSYILLQKIVTKIDD